MTPPEDPMRHDSDNKLHRRIDNMLLVFIMFASVVAIVGWLYITIGHARYFDGYFANGAFQLLNPLRRIMDGQVLGKDFVVFHGIGTILLHLPIYWLFGQDLQASEISRFFVSGLLHLIACVWLWSVLRKRTGGWTPVLMALLFFVGTAFALDRILLPQNSLLGTRSIFPIYVALAMARGSSWIRLALLAGLALVTSPEHGIATIAGLIACIVISLSRHDGRKNAGRLMLSVIAACATYYIVVWVVSHGIVMPNIKYSLLDIPTDQFWYFGVRPNAYLPNDYSVLFSWGYLTFTGLWLLGLIATLMLLRIRSAFSMPAVFLFVYATFGTISQLGYLFYGNLQGSERALILVSILGIVELNRKKAITAFAICSFSSFMLLGYAGRDAITYAWPEKPPETGAFISPYWRQHLSTIEQLAPNGTIWSVYAGLPEATRNQYAPTFDYIIHALGPQNRANYVATFNAAHPAVVRLDNAKTWGFGWWLISSNWEFYRSVFVGYDLANEDKMSTLWTPKKRNTPIMTQQPVLSPDVVDNCFTITDDTKARGRVYDVTLAYSIVNPWSKVPIIGQTPRQIISTDRPNDTGISLPPTNAYGGHWNIPLVLKSGETVKMCTRIDTFLPRIGVKLHDVKITAVPVTESAHSYLSHLWE